MLHQSIRFCTIYMDKVVLLYNRLNIALFAQQLRQKHRAAGSAPEGIVAQAHELVVILGVLPQAAQGDGHAVLQHPVQLGLGAEGSSNSWAGPRKAAQSALICSMEGLQPSLNFMNTAAM